MQRNFFFSLIGLLLFASAALAQTTAFTYQGKLTDAGNPANGNFDLQFKLFDTVTVGTGAQQGITLVRNPVTASAGVFTVTLDFGANVFSGADRYLEIGVRPAGSGSAYTLLAPRQPLTSSPYAIQTLNAQQLGGVAANQYLQTNGNGAGLTNLNAGSITTGTLSNARLGQLPTANLADGAVTAAKIASGQVVKSVNTLKDDVTLAAGANISITPAGNTLTIAATGSGNPIFNQTTLQTPANFNISGNGYIGGNLGVGTTNPLTKLTVQTASFSPGFTQTDGTVVVGSHISTGNARFGTSTNHSFDLMTNNLARLSVDILGNVGIGNFPAPTRLFLEGGPAWTSAGWNGTLAMTNASAIGWAANASGQRFGLGQSSGGFYFFRTNSSFGNTANPANYDMIINDAGNVGIGTLTPSAKLQIAGTGANGFTLGVEGHVTQNRDKGGFVKALLFVNFTGGIVSCYNGLTGATSGSCGFTVSRPLTGQYLVDFGFHVSDRFISVTPFSSFGIAGKINDPFPTANSLYVTTVNIGSNTPMDSGFFLIVY
jgi:hypothetical protein